MTTFLLTVLAAMLFLWIGSIVFIVAILWRPRLRKRLARRELLRQKGNQPCV